MGNTSSTTADATLLADEMESVKELEKSIQNIKSKIDLKIASNDNSYQEEIVEDLRAHMRSLMQIEKYGPNNLRLGRFQKMHDELQILNVKLNTWRMSSSDSDSQLNQTEYSDLNRIKCNDGLNLLKILKINTLFTIIFELLEETGENVIASQIRLQDIMSYYRASNKQNIDNKKTTELVEISEDLITKLDNLKIFNEPKLKDIKPILLSEMKELTNHLNGGDIQIKHLENLCLKIHGLVSQIEKISKHSEYKFKGKKLKPKIQPKQNSIKCADNININNLQLEVSDKVSNISKSDKSNQNPSEKLIYETINIELNDCKTEVTSTPSDETNENGVVYMNGAIVKSNELARSLSKLSISRTRPPVPLPRNNEVVLINNLPLYWKKLAIMKDKPKLTQEEKQEFIQIRSDFLAVDNLFNDIFEELQKKCIA